MGLGSGRVYPQSTRAHTPTTRVISIYLSMASPGGLSSAMEHGPTTVCPYFGLEGIDVPMPCASSLFSLLSTPKLLFPQTGSPKLTLLFGIKTKYISQAQYLPTGAYKLINTEPVRQP